MTITHDFDVNCDQCLDTGEYFDGKKMITCYCDAGKKLKKENDFFNLELKHKTNNSKKSIKNMKENLFIT